MSITYSNKNARYYNVIVWSLVAVLVLVLLPWTGDWNLDALRIFILVVLLILLSPTILNWLGYVGILADAHGRTRPIFYVNNFFFSLSVAMDRVLNLIPNNIYVGGYCAHVHSLGFNYMIYDKQKEAEKIFETLVAEIEKKSGKNSPFLIDAYGVLIGLYRDLDKHPECENVISRFNALVDIHEKDVSSVQLGDMLADAAVYLGKMGKIKESERAIEKAMSLFKTGDDKSIEIFRLSVLTNIGLACCYNERMDQALKYLKEHNQLAKRHHGAESIETALSNCNLSWVLNECSQFEESRTVCEQAIQICEKNNLDEKIKTPIFVNYSEALAGVKRAEEAEKMLNKCLPQLLKLKNNCLPDSASSYRTMARVYGALGQEDEARMNYEKAVSMLTESIGAEHPRTRRWSKELKGMQQL